jgi:hypothetical protein
MEAVRAGRTITRIALAFEAGCDGFWLARGVEAHVDPALSLRGPPTDISSENRSSLWRAGSGVLPLGHTRVALFVANEVTLRGAPGDACSVRRSDHDKRQY